MNRKILIISITAILALSLVLVGSADDEIAARTVPSECINPGEEFIVTVELPPYGMSGLVIEILCDDWEYVDSSLDDFQVIDHTAVNNTLIFTLVGDKTFNYTVKAPGTSEGCCEITGVFRDMDQVDSTIGADTVCTCASAILPTLVRTVPADCIDCNTTFTVTVETPGTGVVIETLCDDWTYVSSSLDVCQVTTDGNAVTFVLEEDASFTYTVQAPDTENAGCTIQGIFSIDNVDHNFIEDFVCTCESGVTPPTLVRTVPADCINLNTQFTVTVETPGTGAVIETLCDDWTYVSSSLETYQVSVDGNTITFTIVNDTSFTYTVQAPDTLDASCTIQGIFKDMDKVEHDFIDDSVCTESGVTPPTLVRTVPTDCIDRNTQFTVTVETLGTGLVTETLCNDWTYVSSSLDACQVITDGNTVTFTLINDTSFTYTVQAPATEDVCCTIQGIFRDMDKVDHDFKDDSVCTCIDISPTDTQAPVPTEIPEFPIIAIPIMTILGMMFLLSRRK